jgi:hypothetical protein
MRRLAFCTNQLVHCAAMFCQNFFIATSVTSGLYHNASVLCELAYHRAVSAESQGGDV